MGLRKLQPVIFEDEDEPLAAPQPEPAPQETAEMFVRTPAYSGPERRKSDRRGMDALRSEALQKVMAQVEDRNFGGIKDRVAAPWRGRMKASRYVLLMVAVVAGGLAAWLATQRDPMVTPAVAQPEPVVVAEPMTKVLVAAETLPVGHRLTGASLVWMDWPADAVQAEYITDASAPDAAEAMAGYVARSEVLAGEPVRSEKLVPVAGGYLSAVLDGGMRAVSVNIMAQAASGGFVVPNDRVDVVLTRSTDNGNQSSATIVTNVRVLAINNQLGETESAGSAPATEAFSGEVIATLELDPIQTEVLIGAATMGQLSFVLRSTLDADAAATAGLSSANQAIRLTSPFWTN